MDDNNNRFPVEGRIGKYQEQLRRLASELSLTEARERREIASDLHDHIGQALAYVTQRVSRLQGNSIFSGMDEDFSEIVSILRQTIRYTRDLTVQISPPVLYELGLPAAIEWLAERELERNGLEIKVSRKGEVRDIREDVSVFMFKAVQELVANIVKHAGTGRAEIILGWKEDEFEIEVKDDGKGFDAGSTGIGNMTDCCFGLFSIRERLSYLGGTLRIESSPGNGTCVSMAVHCDTPDGADDD